MSFTGLISWIAYKEGIALMKMGVRIWFCMFLLAHCVPMTSCTCMYNSLYYCPLFYAYSEAFCLKYIK